MKKYKPLLTKADIDWLIDSMKLVFPTRDEFDRKVNKVYEKLDMFIGEMKAFRDTQELHAQDHARINDRLDTLETKTGVATSQ